MTVAKSIQRTKENHLAEIWNYGWERLKDQCPQSLILQLRDRKRAKSDQTLRNSKKTFDMLKATYCGERVWIKEGWP